MPDLRFAAIADDFTGASDLAGMLARGGLKSIQAIGVQGLKSIPAGAAEGLVVALKSRSVDSAIAIRESLEAADALHRLGARRIYFKYCSTFDSTSAGNIGPVAEALRVYLQAPFVPFAPAFPQNGRRVFQGHLFVGNTLLHESGMESHPLNPMRDSNLVRLLRAQSQSEVGLVTHDTIRRGAGSVKDALGASAAQGKPLVIMDAIDDESLAAIAEAVLDSPLATGASALGFQIARKLTETEWASPFERAAKGKLSPRPGRSVILSGSCSRRALEQIAHFRGTHHPSLRLPVGKILNGEDVVEPALRWFAAQSADVPSLIYTSSDPSDMIFGQDSTPEHSITRRIENALAAIALGVVSGGVTRLIVAGGETSGAIVGGLGISALKIGSEISPGVPWTQVLGPGPAENVCVALKSGNFGGPEFFTQAFECLELMEKTT